nr:MAG TPA: hypothetical protein [Caudoviricetes sp.]
MQFNLLSASDHLLSQLGIAIIQLLETESIANGDIFNFIITLRFQIK